MMAYGTHRHDNSVVKDGLVVCLRCVCVCTKAIRRGASAADMQT